MLCDIYKLNSFRYDQTLKTSNALISLGPLVALLLFEQAIVMPCFHFMQRFVMSSVVCMEGFVTMVNVSSDVQIMRATLVKRVRQYCPACQCAMMYWFGILKGSIVHQVNSVYYSNLKQ